MKNLETTTIETNLDPREQLEQLSNNEKDYLIDSVIFHTEQIDFTDFQDVSIDAMFEAFIRSESFLKLCERKRSVFFDNYRNLMQLNSVIEQFQKENKIYRYSK